MRLVLDTNIVISGLMWRGPPYRLLHAIRSQHRDVQIYSSPTLLEEFTDVITRPTFGKRLNLIGKTPHDLLADYIGIIELIEPAETPRLARDPDDDHVLACAMAAHADVIVSGDRDLLDLGNVGDIRILSASEALAVLGKS